MEQCNECDFRYGDVDPDAVSESLKRLATEHAELLAESDVGATVRTRPAPTVWSALEYVCHVRDVLLIQRDRVILALVEDCPRFAPMYRDERVVLASYRDESVDDVADAIEIAATLFSRVFDQLSAEQLARKCIYNFPAPTERDVSWLGRHTLHEAAHHLVDLKRVLSQARGNSHT
ncbi:MAG: DinB family protein [Acidimicrobiales bacterium]